MFELRIWQKNPHHPGSPEVKAFLSKTFKELYQQPGRKPISRTWLAVHQKQLTACWRRFALAHPGPWLMAPGCLITGLELALDNGWPVLLWVTKFEEGPRHTVPSGNLRSLGYAGEFDLYLQINQSLYHDLLIVSERGTEVWSCCRPEANISLNPPNAVFKDALNRAYLINALWDTRIAKPGRTGAIGLPYQIDS